MNLESDDTDNDDNLLFGKDTSTDDSEHGKNASHILHEHPKKSSNTRKNISEKIFINIFFSIYLESDSPYKYVPFTLTKKHNSFVLI
jgi:hypothetical protein